MIVEFWRGGLPLGRAFWLWGILGGGIVSRLTTLLALMLLAAGAPAWLAVLVFAAHIPWNIVLLVGVWRSAGRPEVSHAAANIVRLTILCWVVVSACFSCRGSCRSSIVRLADERGLRKSASTA